MVHFTKLFTIAPGVGLVNLLSHELFLQIQRPLIPLLPLPSKVKVSNERHHTVFTG